MAKRREIRNSTAEFLIFQIEGKEQGVEVYYKDKTVWCTPKAMGMLFDCSTDNMGLHLKNIYESGELREEATTEKISVVRLEGNRTVNRTLQFYNLDAVISVGYRVNASAPLSSVNGRRVCSVNMPSEAMYLTRSGWRTGRFSARITLSICWLRSGRFVSRNGGSTRS